MHYSLDTPRAFDRFEAGFDAWALTVPEAPASRPILLAVDEDEEALRGVSRELHKRYGDDYRVVWERSPRSALQRLGDFEAVGEEVAMVLADQWMEGMSGTEFLTRAREISPTAKRALLVVWARSRWISPAATRSRRRPSSLPPAPPTAALASRAWKL